MKSAPEIRQALSDFHGSCEFVRWSFLFRRDVLTEGAHYLAESAQCFWLMDAIASHQTSPKVRSEEFQVWSLRPAGLDRDGAWILTGEDGNGNGLADQVIQFTDFPLDAIRLFACRNEQGGVTIMLPSEY